MNVLLNVRVEAKQLLLSTVVLFKFDISSRILTTVLFRATLKYIFLLHVACLLVKITCISVPVAIACI